jgi:hypothetical protein
VPLRTDILARLLLERLLAHGETPEAEAVDSIEQRAPGRSEEVIQWAVQAGLVRQYRRNDNVAMLEARTAPRSLAA